MHNKFPKLLVISRNAWQDINCTGNTLSNLFNDWDDNCIANIFCRAEIPKNDICKKYYQITEKSLILNILKGEPIGHTFDIKNDADKMKLNSVENTRNSINEKKVYDFLKLFRLNVFWLIREYIWKIAKWKNQKFRDFLIDFNPDIIYMHVYDSFYMHDVLIYVQKVTKAKVVLFFTDDNCSYKQFSFSPFFWLRRVLLNNKVKHSLSITDKAYAISEKMCNEYSILFHKDFKILKKCGNFTSEKNINLQCSSPIKLVYAGNIYCGRWKTLFYIAAALEKINKDCIRVQLYIYTYNHISNKIKKYLNIDGTAYLMGGISYSEIKKVLADSDIVIHVEAMDLKNKMMTRFSFSTKIIDYFESGSCIFAVGWSEAASIDYLIKNDAAIVVNDLKNIEESLRKLIDNPQLILDYGRKAWECGKRNHQIEVIRGNLYKDLYSLCDD